MLTHFTFLFDYDLKKFFIFYYFYFMTNKVYLKENIFVNQKNIMLQFENYRVERINQNSENPRL